MGLKSILKGAFPFIAAASTAGGPLGVMAAGAVGHALGIENVEPTPDGISSAIAAAQVKDPDALLKLQTAEQDFQVTMTKLGFDNVEKLEQIAAEDRANARAREIAVKDQTPRNLAYTMTLALLAVIVLVIFKGIPADSHDIVIALITALTTGWVGAMGYYFGSSSGSATKTEIIAKQADK